MRGKYFVIMKIEFTKMHGAGNDYIYVNTMKYAIDNPEELSIRWSRFHTGIGSDGLVLIGASKVADFSMRIFNADGSEAMMCGNASRCIGKYVYEYGLTDKSEITLETLSGIKKLHLNIDGGVVKSVTVDMDSPQYANPVELGDGYQYQGGIAVSMGNPHLVIFVNDIAQVELEKIGPQLEHHPLFPDRVNVEFVQRLADGKLRMRVWERGSGITQACGTGACATFVAASHAGLCGESASVVMDGGTLRISRENGTGHILMEGPAVKVFDGTIDTEATFQ